MLADEQEDMIDKYLPNGVLFALYDDDLKSICDVVPIHDETCELKSIATYKQYQGRGYGRQLINYISDFYKDDYQTMVVGTGEIPKILSFYESCGFEKYHRIKNFFTNNYNQPIFEGNTPLVDMVYLKKNLHATNLLWGFLALYLPVQTHKIKVGRQIATEFVYSYAKTIAYCCNS